MTYLAFTKTILGKIIVVVTLLYVALKKLKALLKDLYQEILLIPLYSRSLPLTSAEHTTQDQPGLTNPVLLFSTTDSG